MSNCVIVRVPYLNPLSSEQVWPIPPREIDITSQSEQSEAVGYFLNPLNCLPTHYLVASVRGDTHSGGSWLTIATMEWVMGVATVVIREPGKPNVEVMRENASAAQVAIAAQLTSLLNGTNNVQPTSEYRGGG